MSLVCCCYLGGSAGLAYRSRSVEEGSGPRGSDISLYGQEEGSRSSSPGCHWREKTVGELAISRVPTGLDAPSSHDILNRRIHQTDNLSAVFIYFSDPHIGSFIPLSHFNLPLLWIYHPLPPFLSPLLLLTHSSDSRSLVSLSLSLKQPRECMLSRTSGSISSAEASVLMATFLGTGCSGSGSFFPALQHNTYN